MIGCDARSIGPRTDLAREGHTMTDGDNEPIEDGPRDEDAVDPQFAGFDILKQAQEHLEEKDREQREAAEQEKQDRLDAAAAEIAGKVEAREVERRGFTDLEAASCTPWGASNRARYPVPDDASFITDFKPANDLNGHLGTLVRKWPELAFIKDLSVLCLWKRKGGERDGRAKVGEVKKLSGLHRYQAGVDFVVILAADNIRASSTTNRQLEAILYHELKKIDWDDEHDKPLIRPHDLEIFYSEVDRYGLWRQDIAAAAGTFQQQAIPDLNEMFAPRLPIDATQTKMF